MFGHLHGVGRHQFNERIAALALIDAGDQFFLKLGKLLLHALGRAPAIERNQRQDDAKGDREGHNQKKRYARQRKRGRRKLEGIRDPHQGHGGHEC